MQNRKQRGCRLAAFVVVLALASSAFASGGRDFAGYYAINHAQQVGDNVTLTLTLQIFNHSDADIKNATVALHHAQDTAVQGSYAVIKSFPDQRDVRLSREFTVPVRDFERWKMGTPPILTVRYKDAHGTTWTKSIQLSRRAELPTS